jgi:GNAT superfamily N-acetyltransferase
VRTGDKWLPLLDSFFSEYLGCDLSKVKAGEVRVCSSSRREKPEPSYADAFPVWCFVTRNRCVVSVHPLLLGAVSRFARGHAATQFRSEQMAERLAAAAVEVLGLDTGKTGNSALPPTEGRKSGTVPQSSSSDSLRYSPRFRRGTVPVFRASHASGPVFFGPPETFCGKRLQTCRVVTEADRPALEDAGLLNSSLLESVRDGTCFAAYDGEKPAALCGVMPVPHMADHAADIALSGTLEPLRRRGFGRTVLSAVTETVQARGRIPFYITSSHNTASIKTAASVGYLEYGWQFRVKAPGSGIL